MDMNTSNGAESDDSAVEPVSASETGGGDEVNSEGSREGLCGLCDNPLATTYFTVNGAIRCPACAETSRTTGEERSGTARLVRAAVAGSVAGALGAALYYLIRAITDYEIGLVAIVVGFMVGGAVRWGAGWRRLGRPWAISREPEVIRRGGRVYQLMAALITYVAICVTYVPYVLEGLTQPAPAENGEALDATGSPNSKDAVGEDPSPAEGADNPTSPPGAEELPPVTALEMLLGVLLVFGLALAAPFLAGLENIIGMMIVAFGVWEAWRINRETSDTLTGPLDYKPQQPPA